MDSSFGKGFYALGPGWGTVWYEARADLPGAYSRKAMRGFEGTVQAQIVCGARPGDMMRTGYVLFFVSERFIEALKDYVVINTLNTRYTIHSTMKDIEAKLPEADFMRVHRSFIVRIDKITAIEQPNLILENDKKVIPIGGSYKDELAKRLNLV